MNSLYFKNFMLSAGMVLMSFLILGCSFVVMGRAFIISDRRDGMEATAKAVVNSVGWLSTPDDMVGFNLRLNIGMISELTGNRIFVCGSDGVVQLCSDSEFNCEHIGKQISERYIAEIHNYGKLDTLTDLDGFYDKSYYVVSLPVMLPESNIEAGYVFVSFDSSSIMKVWETFLQIFAATSVTIMLATFALAHIASKRQTKPINEMAMASRRFARGDFSVRVDDEGREDEIGALTVSFNNMAESLEKAEELRREFIANVSHELKTPMTTISGFADGLLDGTIPKENQDKYIETISAETKRLSRLVRKMLDLSQIQSVSPENLRQKDFDISEILRRTVLNFENKVTERGLDINIQLPEQSIMVLGDSDAITQVVYNLLDNAVKFAESGSVIDMSLWKQGVKAYVSVRNEGETIDGDEISHIFDRFHKTDRSRSRDRDGVGLGLYLVKSILNNHDEDIFVTSRDGVTEFVFSLTLKPGTGSSRTYAQTPPEDEI